jgi:hypothetical protein
MASCSAGDNVINLGAGHRPAKTQLRGECKDEVSVLAKDCLSLDLGSNDQMLNRANGVSLVVSIILVGAVQNTRLAKEHSFRDLASHADQERVDCMPEEMINELRRAAGTHRF